ncbi:restriction endonuclease subunit S [Chromobacterium vaccinii]|uniref:restriction endonuclease subunit S n=1 Tax=Chromobacterium vaccinii TaxID=1108595 RepID=UPI0031D0D480
MSRYKAHPEYKDSGVEWLGEIPTRWKLIRLKFMARIKNGQDYKNIEADEGYPVIGSGGQFTYASCFAYQNPSVLLGRKGTVDKPLYIDQPFWTVDTMYYTEIHDNIFPKYLYYLATTIQFDKYSTNTALPSMTQENLGNYTFSIPESDLERKSIAIFLDYENAKIDALIEKQQALIALLKEKRQAVISHAVTKGLNPDTPMKNSGVEWLGVVPESWSVLQIRHVLLNLEQGKSPECENRPANQDEWGVLKTGCVNYSRFNEDENKCLPDNLKPCPQFEVKAGDVLMSRASGSIELIGSVAYVFQTRSKLLLSDKIFRLQFNSCINKLFFAFLMQSTYMRTNVKNAISGAEGMANNIAKSSILSFRFALPSLEEQNKIVNYVSRELLTFNKLIQDAVKAVELLKERRTALISAAVTGKIDVRDWQPPEAAA